MLIKLCRLHPDAIIPTYAHINDAGADLYSRENIKLCPNQRYAVPTGIAVEIPIGYEGQIRSRSGLAINKGLKVLNSPGTIDAGYRGEIKVILINLGWDMVELPQGSRIAQLIISPVIKASFIEVDSLSDSQRENQGFGSSGI